MEKAITVRGIAAGFLAAAVILPLTSALAGLALSSPLFRGSRFAAFLLSEDSLSLSGILTEPEKLDAAVKFLGAVTAAYIDFEMIPLGEAGTFSAVLEALGGDISVEGFDYKGKTLVITGKAPDVGAAEAFCGRLRKLRFPSATYHAQTAEDGSALFTVECNAAYTTSRIKLAT